MTEYLPPFLALDTPIPAPGENQGPVCFTFDAKWIPYILSVLKSLTVEGVWANDQENALGQASQLIDIFMSNGKGNCVPFNDLSGSEMDDCMGCCIRMREGVLQVLQCGEWVTVDGWDAAAIASTPTQPGKGSPQPAPGKCQNFIAEVTLGSKWALPVPVSTGDQITVTNATGTWWTLLDLGILRCPDGLIYFAGDCVDGTAHTESGDPMPTANHDNLIAYDGTHYYDCGLAADSMSVVFTIGAGVSNATLFFQGNTADTAGFGSTQFDVTMCNNAPATWTKTLDFQLNSCGAIFPIPGRPVEGVWTPGTGYLPTDITLSGCFDRRIEFQLAVPIATLNSIRLVYDLTHGDLSCASSPDVAITLNNDAIVPYDQRSDVAPNGSHVSITANGPWSAVSNLRLYFTIGSSPTAYGGSGVVRQLILTGTGTEPTWPC